MSLEIIEPRQPVTPIFDAARLKAADQAKSDKLADSIAKAAIDLKLPTSPKILGPIAAVALLAVSSGANFLANRLPTAKATEETIIKPLPGVTINCMDHPYKSPIIPYNHLDVKAPLPLEKADSEGVVRIIESGSNQTAQAPISEAVKLGVVKKDPNSNTLEVHNYLPGFDGETRDVTKDLKMTPGKKYTLAVELDGTLYVSNEIQTSQCTP